MVLQLCRCHRKKLCSRVYSIELEFYSQKQIRFFLFEPPVGGVRGNVRTSSIPRWKARGRLSIRDNLTLRDKFNPSYGSDAISRYWSNINIQT